MRSIPETKVRNFHDWDGALATESIVVRIRWFGIAMGYVLVQTRVGLHNASAVRAFLALGAGYAALDTVFHRMGEVFLVRWPLFVSGMESIFIALLCYHDTGLDSPFRWYYLLSAICCAIRYRPTIAWVTVGLHSLSLAALAWALSATRNELSGLALTLVILQWATWASSSLARRLNVARAGLEAANEALERHRAELERRVADRTAALRASQARVIHQEKMAAFGLLAAGIAHEVGNPLAAISSLIQMLQRRRPDAYTAEKLDLTLRQLGRIQRTVREVVDFSRPASVVVGAVRLADVVEEALGIAKFYRPAKDRILTMDIPADLPTVRGIRDHVMQVVLNLLLNAIDATSKDGHITLVVTADGNRVELCIVDDGQGIASEDQDRLFEPFFTTKPKGTGLGLFVSRQIAEEMGGTLTCRSEWGQGSKFTLRLPAIVTEPVPILAGEAVG